MSTYQKARNLREVPAIVDLQPLAQGDERWVDLSKGRDSEDMSQLRVFLRDHSAAGKTFAKAVFTGHRGCGKTTELLRLMHDVSSQFTPILMVADDALLGDYEYSDLFLWLADQVVGQFRDRLNIELEKGLIDQTEHWFAEITSEVVTEKKSELAVGSEVEAGLNYSWWGTGLKVLGRLKSMITGSTQRRHAIRQTLQRHVFELINRVNLILDDAHDKLKLASRPADRLIVVDNLDRLGPEVARRLFHDNGDFLKAASCPCRFHRAHRMRSGSHQHWQSI